jgi:hypothetical protein
VDPDKWVKVYEFLVGHSTPVNLVVILIIGVYLGRKLEGLTGAIDRLTAWRDKHEARFNELENEVSQHTGQLSRMNGARSRMRPDCG